MPTVTAKMTSAEMRVITRLIMGITREGGGREGGGREKPASKLNLSSKGTRETFYV